MFMLSIIMVQTVGNKEMWKLWEHSFIEIKQLVSYSLVSTLI